MGIILSSISTQRASFFLGRRRFYPFSSLRQFRIPLQMLPGQAEHWGLLLTGSMAEGSIIPEIFPPFILVLPNSLTTLQKAKHKSGWDWFGSERALLRVQCRLRAGDTSRSVTTSLALSWSSGQQPGPSQTKLTDLIRPKVNMWDFALLLSWALRIKATAAVPEKQGENNQTENPVAFSNSFVSWKICLASLLIKGTQSYLKGLPWRYFISVRLIQDSSISNIQPIYREMA